MTKSSTDPISDANSARPIAHAWERGPAVRTLLPISHPPNAPTTSSPMCRPSTADKSAHATPVPSAAIAPNASARPRRVGDSIAARLLR